jgi:dCTP deaminase
VFTRVLCDAHGYFDRTPPGYHGKLYLEVTPKSFDIGVTEGHELMQGRLKRVGQEALDDERIKKLHTAECLLCDKDGRPLDHNRLEIHDRELFFHIDLDRDIVGFAVKSTLMQSLDMSKKAKGTMEPDNFWQPIRRPKNGELVLVPEHFYLLCTKERVRIPTGVCGQIPAYSPAIGEMRTHYAGFFDPNFGGEYGTSGVLEVRVRDMPFTFVDGQVVCSMKFEQMDSLPDQLYGQDGTGSSYTGAGPSLSNHFRMREEAWEKAYWRSLWE